MLNKYTKIMAVSIIGLTAFNVPLANAELNIMDPLQYSLLKAKLGAKSDITYNDNIFRSPSSKESDFIATFSPRLKISSDFDKHYLGATAKIEGGHYFSNNDSDYVDANIDVDGRIDLNDSNAIYLGGKYKYDHVAIGSFVDDLDAKLKEPVTYTRSYVYSRIIGNKNRFHYGAGVDGYDYDYNNVSRVDGTINIQNDRDKYGYNISAQLGYEFVPMHQVYVLGKYGERIHNERIDSSAAFTKDSNSHIAAIGISHDEKDSEYKYNAFVGYLEQNYNSSQMPDVKALDFYLDAQWNVTGRNQIKVKADRQVKDSYSDGVSAYLKTKLDLSLRHKYSKDISFGAGVNYENNDFENNASITALKREDDTYGVKVWGQKELREDLYLKVRYDYRDRDSNDSNASYKAQKIGLSLSYKY